MKKTIYIFLSLYSILTTHYSFSQNKQLDSLEALLKTAADDTNKVKILYQLSEVCDEENILRYAEPSLQLSEKLNYKPGIANALNNIGFELKVKGQVEKALECFIRSLKIRE